MKGRRRGRRGNGKILWRGSIYSRAFADGELVTSCVYLLRHVFLSLARARDVSRRAGLCIGQLPV